MVRHINVLLILLLGNFAVSSRQDTVAADAAPKDDKDGALVAVETEENDAESSDKQDSSDPKSKVSVSISEDYDPNAEVFYPTKEWQVVKPGQAIPKGLHVRMDFQTKIREAKLMDGDDGMKYWKQGEKKGMVNTKNKYFTRDEIKDALKQFKAESDDVKDEKIKEEALKKKFKSYNELKADFKKMKMEIKTDGEIITKLLKMYKNSAISVLDRKAILTDFEFYLHQIDNAVDFSEMGGLDLVIKDLNHTDSDIRSEAAFVIGAAVQSNPKVQIKAMEAGAMQQLIRMQSTETDLKLRSRVLYALSCLMRLFPYAQSKFLELGGLSSLTSLFNQEGVDKLKVKAVSLAHDMLLERQNVIRTANEEDSHQKDKLRQYKKVLLREAMIEQGWCEHIPKLLGTHDHDTREKVIYAMEIILQNCKSNFVNSVGTLQQLKSEYEHLSMEEKKEGDDDYFQKLFTNLTNIISALQTKDEL